MGGNALKEPSIRLGREKYVSLSKAVLKEVKEYFLGASLISSYSEKETFGDMDILVVTDDGKWPEEFKESSFLQNREVVWNGPVCSLGWDLVEGRFQIDLILVESKYCRAAASYFAYNDLGNLLGIIAKSLGFKLGHKGLWKRFYHPDKPTEVIFSVEVDTSWGEILWFLGVPSYWIEKWRVGLDSLEDIFRMVQSSRYYHPDLYLLENRNSVSRVRDAKRVTYTKFLEYCAAQERPAERAEVDVGEHLQRAFAEFPLFKQRFAVENLAWVRRLEIKTLLSGNRVSELTGLTGPELGRFMMLLKKALPPDDKTTFNNKEFIEGYILGMYSLWYKLGEVDVANALAQRLRSLDYSVVMFNPEELTGCNNTTVGILEETLISKGWELIDKYAN